MGIDPGEKTMTTTLAMSDPNQPRKAIKTRNEFFQTVSVTLAWLTDGVYGLYTSFEDILGETTARAHLIGQCIQIAFQSGGREQIAQFVRLTDFLNAGSISRKNVAFRDFLSGFVEPVLEQGFVVSAEHADSPSVQHAAALLAIAINADKARKESGEAKQIAGEAKQIGLGADAKAEMAEAKAEMALQEANRAARAKTSEANWFQLVTWADLQGIELDSETDGKDEGWLLAIECKSRGITPIKEPTSRFPKGVNKYPLRMLLWWKEDYYRRNPAKRTRRG
jgi:hypothetical protein